MSLYYNGKLQSGVRDIPSMSLSEYNLLTNKPKLWIRTDAPDGDRGINADDIEYSTGVSVKDKIDSLQDGSYIIGGSKNCQCNLNVDLGTIASASDAAAFVSDHHIDTGEFSGLKVGSRIKIQDGTYNVYWRIAGFDIYMNVGLSTQSTTAPIITQHHIGLIPNNNLTTAVMNDTATTTGGYGGSKMFTTTLPALDTKLKAVMGTHLLRIPCVISSTVTSGKSSAWGWNSTDVYSVLMSEVQVLGNMNLGNNFDVGEGYEKLPIFNFIPPTYLAREKYWLRTVCNSTDFGFVAETGIYANVAANAGAIGLRPLILLG